MADIKQLTERALHAAIARTVTHMHDGSDKNKEEMRLVPSATHSPSSFSRLQLQSSDFDAAFRGFIPSSLKDLSTDDASSQAVSTSADSAETGWASVGGMFELKRTLLDTLELPTRYATLFASAPLKLRSGLLLYGPPGVGKTLIANHVAARAGLNFISVKGPELLNKYIGSSEQNVRDLFERARAAAPCLLFFDEMESIVPRRGGDSTGVTDRVVNQFLCELDGVEGSLSGGVRGKQVYVLGASSRPDLIDPALLRPGRLDKAIYCAMPIEAERQDMLRAMTRTLTLDASVDFSVIAARTHDYTPADLQAIVTNAQMSLVQQVMAEAQEAMKRRREGGDSSSTTTTAPLTLPPLTQSHLLRALAASKPSTAEHDRRRYERIYRKFQLNRGEQADGNEFDPNKPQKQIQA